jgi:hypothetical protein
MFDIGKVADTVVEMCGMVSKDIDTVWKYYIHDLVKEGHSLEEIKAYIQHKQNFGENVKQEETNGCSGECDLCPEADGCDQCGSV